MRGTRQSGNGSSGTTPPFAEVLNTAEAWVIGEADQQVRLKLDQRLLLEGEGFQADLTLANQLAGQSADDITVNLLISDTNNVLVNSSFIITPVVPTLLTDTLPAGAQVLGSWLIVPTESVTGTAGKIYYAAAEITYELGGTSYTFTTLPEQFTVLPAPELAVEYRLPDPTYTCSIFDLEATVYNTGVGPARGVSLSSGQPRLVESTNGDPQSFRIIGVSVDGQPSSTLDLDQSLGDIPAGQNRRIVWRMESTKPGRFVEFTSGFHRIQDYAGLPLVVPRLTISTTFTTPSNPFAYGCLTDAFTISGNVKNFNGDPVTNMVFLVGFGISTTTMESTSIITPIIDVSGAFTIPNVFTGTYTIVPLRSGQQPSLFSYTPKSYTVIPASTGSSPLMQSEGNEYFRNCKQALRKAEPFMLTSEINDICSHFVPSAAQINLPEDADETGNSGGHEFIEQGPAPDPPTTPSFEKGANWLQNQAQPYEEEDNIGWNIDRSSDILDKPATASAINEIHDNNPNMKTLVRLDSGRPTDPGQALAVDCNDFEDWMEATDTLYDNVKTALTGVENLTFILDNEPNHNIEWGYTGQQYAKVFNCYYEHWQDQSDHTHPLYVAGPGRPDDASLPNEREFYEQLFDGNTAISATDGFAIHAYGYNVNDEPDTYSEYENWLFNGMSNIRNSSVEAVSQAPVVITEYNPGARDNEVEEIRDSWLDWFNHTSCWTQNYGNQIQGLLYFVDASNPERPATCQGPWCAVALQNQSAEEIETRGNRREAWLTHNPTNQECVDILSFKEPGQGGGMLASPIIPRHLTIGTGQSQIQRNQANFTIGGIITGTLKRGVYHVTEDLVVPVGQTLVIEDGTYLSFAAGRQMVIAGQLLAGERLPIYFLSEDPQVGWSGMHFLSSAQESFCFRCKLVNIEAGGIAMTVEAPIAFREGQIIDVVGGTAISATVPFTLSNVVIDYVGTALHTSGTPTTTQKASHLTLTRCLQGVVNHNQQFNLDNSIISACVYPVTTELSGTTTISYSLLHNYTQNVTSPDAQLVQGPGILDGVDPGFIDISNNRVLSSDSLAVNAADPQADYSIEPGYNGSRADMGAYGNTGYAPQVPPLDQMGLTTLALTPEQVGYIGETITFTIKIRNTGSVTDSYYIYIDPYKNDFGSYSRLFDYGYKGPELVKLSPQAEITRTVWAEVPVDFDPSREISNTIHVDVFNGFGVKEVVTLTVELPFYQENNGQLVMEAERFAAQTEQSGHKWTPQTNLSGYIGSGYINATPDTNLQFTTTYTLNSPVQSYPISFTITGTYYIWLRGYAPDAAGDSVYVGLDNQASQPLTGFAPRIWSWASRNLQSVPVAIEVTEPGLHILRIWQREDGIRLDRIVLTTDSTYTPNGDGPVESEIR